MRFRDDEKKILLAAPMVGATIIKRIEDLGIHDLAELAQADAAMLCQHIEANAGIKGWGNHSMALQSMQNAIDAAEEHVIANEP